MQFSWDINLSTIFMIGGTALALIRFWIQAEQKAVQADKRATAAEEKADKAHEKIAILQASVNAYQVTQAERLVSREVLREVEGRLAGSIEKLGDRLDSLLREVIQHRGE
ncbi:hypothetical protein [Microvirga mediterraneensis]|uniref:Uncharacterized protein n=1 Tax=Microvirga mediterraneensis TaxID=2754695 RepID=A0A838BRY6_9HYPH|nr:hypothetical protein [Microvirga mediterraneensis]MBA1156942.1 hypothetical protein [Microvirga mediterraneensis]MBA1157742.1 hypothetical protein [Microvirga mediterraneensis]